MPETGTPLARAFARLTIDVADAGTSIQSAVRKGGEAGQKEAESQASKIKEKFKQGLEFGAGFYGGEALFRGVGEGIKTVIESADQLKESSERVDRVFGESSGSVLKFGQDAAKSYGLSASAADQMNVKLGALLTNLHLPQDEAAKMSVQLIKLSADLAAFNHTDTASAEQALQSALAGRTQGLKQYGIVVDSVSVQQQALKDGLIHTVKDALDPAAKAQATYEVILQRSQVQQGAFERGSNSLAEQTKILGAEMTDAGAAIGQKLIPVLVDGAKAIQAIPQAGADVAHFFDQNKALAVAFAGVLGASLVPKLSEFAITAERMVATNLEAFFASGAGGIRAMGTALLENPELYGLAAALAAAGAAVELFAGKEKSASIDVSSLTEAVKQQDTVGGDSLTNQLLKQFTDTDIANRGENVLEYLRRYKVNLSDLFEAINRGNLYGGNGVFQQLQAIFQDPSVSGATQSRLSKFLIGLTNDISSVRAANAALSSSDKDMKAQLDTTPQGRFMEFLGNLQTAQDDLTKSTSDNNKTISGQVDLLKQYSAQADVTASDIQKHLLDNIKLLANEGNNFNTLGANGVDPKFIEHLKELGPEYVAAVASADKQLQVQLGQEYEQGLTQRMHTSAAAARAAAPEAAKVVADGTNFALKAQSDAMKTNFFNAVQSAVNQARNIAGDGGRDTANAFGAHGEAARNKVLQSYIKTLPDPVRAAALSALGIASDAGAQLPANLAAAINSHAPKASQAAENLRAVVQAKIDALHGKTLDIVTQDNASAALNTITGDLRQLEGLNNTLKASRIAAADGGFVSGPGGPRDDVIPAWLSNQEHVTNAASANINRALLTWMDKNPGARVPGFADGGAVDTDVLATHPFVQSFADYLSGGAFASLISGLSGGANSSSKSVSAWASTILQALAIDGAPSSWLDAEQIIMGFESGGNPTIQNLGYTAGGGHPTGLMQMLPDTFAAHALPGHGNINNGLDNLISSIRYQMATYGSPYNIPGVVRGSYGGYDHGGILPPGGVGVNLSGQPEMVRSKTQEDALGNKLDRLIALMEAGNKIAAQQPAAMASSLNGTARTGRLDARTRTYR